MAAMDHRMTIYRNKIGTCLSAAYRCAKRSGSIRSFAVFMGKGLCLCLLVAGCTHSKVALMDNAPQLPNQSLSDVAPFKQADFERELKSPDAQHVADWVVNSRDNQGLPFVIVDKTDAKVFVFHADGRIRGAAPALLGLARGDESIPGIGNRKLSDIRPEERTTPAGRFLASMGINFHGKDILWVDYEGAVSLHRVVTNNPKERRLERLTTPTPLDNRISYGCINVPVDFFNSVICPAFAGTNGIVYVLPEIRSKCEIFGCTDIQGRPGTGTIANLDAVSKEKPAAGPRDMALEPESNPKGMWSKIRSSITSK